jgi:hypothetical protein
VPLSTPTRGTAAAKKVSQTKCNTLFEHVYESYFGDGDNVYRDAA